MDQWILCAKDYSYFETRNGGGEAWILAPAVPHLNKLGCLRDWGRAFGERDWVLDEAFGA